MDDIASFLRRHPPFSGLAQDELEQVAAAVQVQSFEAGEVVLVEDGPPATAFWVPRQGSMELLHADEVVDVLSPGVGFGHLSLLSGLAPTFTVRAHEDAVCYAIPRETALRVLGRPEGAGYLARSLRLRLTRTGHTVHGLPELSTVHVSDLAPERPLFCEPGTSITTAAELMTRSGSSAVLVRTNEILIVTDAIIRARVVAGPISAGNPVIRIAERALLVEPTRLAVDAIVEMLDRNVEHVVVVDGSEIVGVVSATDMLGLQGRSPFALRHAILHAADEDALVAAAQRLRPLFLSLMEAGVSPPDIGRVLTLQYEALIQRLLDFAHKRHGDSPVPAALLLLGSAARRELTPGSDQEHAIAYADTDEPGVDAFFAEIAEHLIDGLNRCGFATDANSVLASDPLWRMSESAWTKTLESCMSAPDRSRLIRATVAFDFRQVSGALDVTPDFVSTLRRASSHPDFIRRLARTATDFKPPLGFRGALLTKSNGERPSGTLDIKRGGMLPIVNLARFHALSNGVTISATLDRLVAVEEMGVMPKEEATGLREAFQFTWRLRLAHHADLLAAGRQADNYVDPNALGPLEREELREALRVIVTAQKRLQVYLPTGI